MTQSRKTRFFRKKLLRPAVASNVRSKRQMPLSRKLTRLPPLSKNVQPIINDVKQTVKKTLAAKFSLSLKWISSDG